LWSVLLTHWCGDNTDQRLERAKEINDGVMMDSYEMNKARK